mmetsp:Transcript_14949/g.25681  ORF Transcript_14949/g.25681 Transcript_14949/m.25681 type:complete len:168 (-) Transcript_14949:277-780(-)
MSTTSIDFGNSKTSRKRKKEVVSLTDREDAEDILRAGEIAGVNKKDNEKIMKQRTRKTAEISARFTKAQQDRYDAYRQSKLPRTAVKRQMQSAGVSSVNDTCAAVMAGITKVFVGELVELARAIEFEWAESGPIQPKHLHEAYRRLRAQGAVPGKPRAVLKRRRSRS